MLSSLRETTYYRKKSEFCHITKIKLFNIFILYIFYFFPFICSPLDTGSLEGYGHPGRFRGPSIWQRPLNTCVISEKLERMECKLLQCLRKHLTVCYFLSNKEVRVKVHGRLVQTKQWADSWKRSKRKHVRLFSEKCI